MRIRHKVNVRISEDTDMENLLFGLSDKLSEVTIDTIEQQNSGTINILEDMTENLDFGDVDQVVGLYIRVDGDCSVTINEGDPINLKVSGSANFPFAKLFIEALIYSVSITTLVATPISGHYCVWGGVYGE